MKTIELTKQQLEILEQVINEGTTFIGDRNYEAGISEEETTAYTQKQRMITVFLRNEGEVAIKMVR